MRQTKKETKFVVLMFYENSRRQIKVLEIDDKNIYQNEDGGNSIHFEYLNELVGCEFGGSARLKSLDGFKLSFEPFYWVNDNGIAEQAHISGNNGYQPIYGNMVIFNYNDESNPNDSPWLNLKQVKEVIDYFRISNTAFLEGSYRGMFDVY